VLLLHSLSHIANKLNISSKPFPWEANWKSDYTLTFRSFSNASTDLAEELVEQFFDNEWKSNFNYWC
jgi:hypothetical protein